jgi:hypothetical protein
MDDGEATAAPIVRDLLEAIDFMERIIEQKGEQ